MATPKFDQMLGVSDVASTSSGLGASLVGVEDSAGIITGTTVEAALAELAARVSGSVATETALKALGAAKRSDGMVVVVLADYSAWVFQSASTATAQDGIAVPDVGTGRWARIALPGANPDYKGSVRAASTAAIGAYTRTANVILANAPGALGAQDGVTLVAGQRYLLKDGAAGADNGVYRIDDVGGGTAFQMTRADDFNASGDITAGALVYVSEGTLNGNAWYMLTTDDAITINSTSLTFTKLPTLADLSSTASGLGASLVGILDAGTFTAQTTVEAALAEIYQHIKSVSAACVPLELDLWREVDANGDYANIAANGGILASDTTPILRADAAESAEIGWATGNVDPIQRQFMVPPNADLTANATLELWVWSGVTDAATFTVETSWDGGGLVSDSADDAGTKAVAVHKITATIAAGDMPDTATRCTIALTPTNAHATDAYQIVGSRLLFKGKALTA